MKTANWISAIGAIVIIVGAILNILHVAVYSPSTLLMVGVIFTIAGQEWKIKLLTRQVREPGANHTR